MKALTYGLVVSSVSWHLEPYKEELTLILNISHQFLKIIILAYHLLSMNHNV